MAVVYQHRRVDTNEVFYACIGNNNGGMMKRWHFDNCKSKNK